MIKIESEVTEYVNNFRDQSLSKDPSDPRKVTSLWTEAVEGNVVTTPERLFYLGADILRIRHGQNWIQKKGLSVDLSAVDKLWSYEMGWEEQRKDYVSRELLLDKIYSLSLFTDMVSLSDYLQIIGSVKNYYDEQLEVRRQLLSGDFSNGLEIINRECEFSVGKLRITFPCSRLYGPEITDENKTACGIFRFEFDPIKLTPEEIQRCGKRIWLAHTNSLMKTSRL